MKKISLVILIIIFSLTACDFMEEEQITEYKDNKIRLTPHKIEKEEAYIKSLMETGELRIFDLDNLNNVGKIEFTHYQYDGNFDLIETSSKSVDLRENSGKLELILDKSEENLEIIYIEDKRSARIKFELDEYSDKRKDVLRTWISLDEKFKLDIDEEINMNLLTSSYIDKASIDLNNEIEGLEDGLKYLNINLFKVRFTR